MRPPLAGTVLALAVTVIAAPVRATEEAPKLRLEPHEFEASNGQRVAAERGYLTVPANRKNPESGTIELAFVRFASTAEKPGSPIVYLAGGPGGSGIGAARGSRFPLFMAFREIADVIAFDQRGTGNSQPFNLCPDRVELSLDQPTRLEEVRPQLEEKIAACRERLEKNGVDLAGLTTDESADDLDDLRRALGAEKITLWGISYGTHLSFAALRRHGEHIDKAILAGIEGPDHTLKPPSQQQELLEQIAELVREDPKLRDQIPDLMAVIERVAARVEKEPVRVALTDPRNGEEVTVAAGLWDLQWTTAQMLRGPESFAGLPDFYWRLDNGDDLALALARAEFSAVPVGRAMSAVMDCVSGASPARLERISREAKQTVLADAINGPGQSSCPAWQVPDAGEEFRSRLESDVPTLFISGTLDGRTPPENAEEIRQGFSKNVHLVIDGAGHSDPLFLSDPRILEVMLAFLEDQPIPTTRIQLPPPEFIAPRKPIELEPEVLARYAGSYDVGGGERRRILLAGNQLFSQRGNGSPSAIRPYSPTEFFYEGSNVTAEFHLDDDGDVVAMSVTQLGSTGRAEKVD